MSYILDALKKSEKERQRGRVPDLMAAQDVLGEEPKRRTLWPYLIAGALILNAGVLAYWLAWNPGKPSLVRQQAAPQRYGEAASEQGSRATDQGLSVAAPQSKMPNTGDLSAKSALEKEPAYRPEIPSAGTEGASSNVLRQSSQERVRIETRKNAENKQATDAGVSSGFPSVPSEQATGAKHGDVESQPVDHPAPIRNKIYGLHDLPSSIRQGLPSFAISTHLYASDASSRVVRINGQVLREGQFLAEGLRVEEIIAEGVIFSYRNYRFRVGLK